MILVVLLNIGGLAAIVLAGVVVLTSGADGATLITAMSFLLPGLVLLGFAQVIHALLRTAKATEATLAEITELKEAQQRMSAVFDRLGKKQA